MLCPPEQPDNKIPSTSASIFKSFLPLIFSLFNALAPTIVVSSLVVTNNSSAGCLAFLSSIIARPIALAIPSSAPKVVPSVLTQSPSTTRGIGSVKKS